MARAALPQAEVITENILSMIRGNEPSSVYTPRLWLEGAIKLTLGQRNYAFYSMNEDGSDYLLEGHDGEATLDVRKIWERYDADFATASADL